MVFLAINSPLQKKKKKKAKRRVLYPELFKDRTGCSPQVVPKPFLVIAHLISSQLLQMFTQVLYMLEPVANVLCQDGWLFTEWLFQEPC